MRPTDCWCCCPALLLDYWAATGHFDAGFYAVQAPELLAGAANLVLMGLNIRDGLRLSTRLGTRTMHAKVTG